MILSKNILVDNIIREISDNSTGQISPYDIRHNLLDIIDSIHLLTFANDLVSKNFATPETRTTKAGQSTLEKLGLNGYYSTDNSAFGYAALKSNYQGIKNTAIGSQSLSCNVFGEENVGVGFDSLGGNTTGHGNVGIGDYSLINNQIGSFNIAIGHGAGYYVPRNTNNKLFIASHPIDADYVCDNPLGSGLTPLVYGDLDDLRFGIGVNTLHNYGTLQVSGEISPSLNSTFNLGHALYRFNQLYLSSGIYFGTKSISINNDNNLSINTNLVPSVSGQYSLGTNTQRWTNGFFDNFVVNYLVALQQAHYLHKTIYLASSGYMNTLDGGGPSSLYEYFPSSEEVAHPQQYLSNADLINAGFIARSQSHEYQFVFKPTGIFNINCLASDSIYSRSSWYSNISLHLNSGLHVVADKVIGNSGEVGLIANSTCFGLNIKDEKIYLSRSNILNPNPATSSGHLAGISNVNFIANSGSLSDYIVTFAAPESGVDIAQRFLTGTKSRVKDSLNNNKDKLRGFEIKYVDDSNTAYSGPLSDRLMFSAFNNTSSPVNNLIFMKDSSDGGVFGINNFNVGGEYLFPETIFNIRSDENAIARITSEITGPSEASIQLLGKSNCVYDGFEIVYKNGSGIVDFNLYKQSGILNAIRIRDNNRIGLFTSVSGQMQDMLTLGDELNTNAVISLRQVTSQPTNTAKYGKIFVASKVADGQSSTVKFIDSSGNIFDLVLNKYKTDDGLLFTDALRNTFGGINCPDKRNDIVSATDNTALGYNALALIETGDFNTTIGSYTGSGIKSGSYNTAIGYRSLTNASVNIQHNIILGTNGLGENLNSNYNFLVGVNNGLVLLSGVMGPNNSNKNLHMPNGGKFHINNNNNLEVTSFQTNIIETIDKGGSDYPENQLTFKFTGNESSNLFILDHSNEPLSTIPSYSSSGVPFAELKGDLKLLRAISFSDGTSLSSAQPINNLYSSGVAWTNAANKINSLIIEGTAIQDINPALNISTATSGILQPLSGSNIFVINRDKYLTIKSGDYVIALKIGNEYRPIWVSSESTSCQCCNA